MWPVFIEKLNCEFLRNDAGGEVQLIIFSPHFYWVVLGVLKCVKNIWITALWTNLDLVNVASIHWEIQVRVFENDAWGEVQLIILFLHQVFTIIYIFRCVKKLEITAPGTNLDLVNVASIRCVIKFRVLRNDVGGEVQLIILFLHFYWVVLWVLECIGKLFITPPRSNLDLVNLASIR